MKRLAQTAVTAGVALSMLAVSPTFASAEASTAISVNTTADTVDADVYDGICADSNGECSLRAAVQTANADGGDNTITLERANYTLSIAGVDTDGAEAGDLDVTSSIVLAGRDAVVELNGLGDRAFDVAVDGYLAVTNLAVRNGSPAEGESGGAFRNAGELYIEGSTVRGNTVVGTGASGGGIFNTGTLTVNRSTLVGNSAARAGGAIEANGGSTSITGAMLRENSTGPMPGNGGALHLTGDGYVEVTRTKVIDNVAAAEGGGLWNSSTGTMVVSWTNLTGNVANGAEADNGGGALFNDGGSLSVTQSKLDGNYAPVGSGSGGGILNNAGTLDISKSSIVNNSAQRAGGGIETVNGTVNITKATLSNNATGPAPGNGGGLHASGTAAMVNIVGTTVADNVAALEGGGLWAGAGDSVMTVSGSRIIGNVANGVEAINGGGGIFNKGGLLVVDQSGVNDNEANMGSGSGGGILNLGTLEVSATRIAGNSAARAGGGIESNSVNGAGNATLTRVTLVDNSTGAAPGNGGGMHVTGSTITTLIDRSVVTGNSAANEGGGLWNFADATMTVTRTVVNNNTAPIAPNVFQNGAGGNFTVNGTLIAPGDNVLAFP